MKRAVLILLSVLLLTASAGSTNDVTEPWLHSAEYENSAVSLRIDAPENGTVFVGGFDGGRLTETQSVSVRAGSSTQTVSLPVASGHSRFRAYFVKEVSCVPQCAAVDAVVPGGVLDYVLNTNTKRFHYPTCASAETISARNRQTYRGTRDAVLAMEYQPCNNCRP